MNVRYLNGSIRLSICTPIVLFSGLILSQFASAATYYVATTGSDSNPGTQFAPFRHVSKGVGSATQPGDTVIVADGTYDNEGVREPNFVVWFYYSGTSANPITIKAQNRGGAILDGGNTSSSCNGAASYFNLYNASFIVIQGFVIQNACDSGFQSNDSAHDITIKQNEIRNIGNWYITDQIGRDGIYLNTSEYNFTFDSNIWHDIGRTGGNTLHFDHGIYSHARNLNIVNNVFYNMRAGWAIQFADGASNYLVANNTFAFPNTGDGETGQVMWWGSNTNITFRNNIFYQPNGAAMTQYAATISGCVFDHNIVYPVSTIMSSTAGCSVTSNLTGTGPNPQFVNASATPPNFATLSGGAGVDAGVNLGSFAWDFAGAARPQGSSTDIGAFEYGSSSSTGGGGTPQPPVISGVFTSSITTSSSVANWNTDQSANAYVQYGLTSNYTNTSAVDNSMATAHSMGLSGLASGTTYHYRVASANSSGQTSYSGDNTFTTAAAPPPPPVAPFAFSMTAASTAVLVGQGQSVSDTINVGLVSGSPASVAFTLNSKVGPNMKASLSSLSCAPTCSTNLTLSVPSNANPGTYMVTVSGSGGGTSASVQVAFTVTASTPPTPPAPSADIVTGMVARWRFVDGGGSTAYDASGFGNNITLSNPTWWSSDYGMTCWFSGSASYGTVNESSSLNLSNTMTVSFWLRPSANSNTDARVITKNYDWDVKLNGANRYPQFSAGSQYAQLNYSLPLITWHHVVFTFSNGTVNGYVDGVPVGFNANTFTSGTALAQYAYGLNVATDPGKANSYIGSLDDVRIYNRALAPADVAALYSALTKP